MVEILKSLSDQTRLRILSIIFEGELCVCELEECLRLTQSNASRHLNTLKRVGILDNYKIAQWTYYKISEEFIKDNEQLYIYLRNNLKKLPSYKQDYEEYMNCKFKDLCDCKNNRNEV